MDIQKIQQYYYTCLMIRNVEKGIEKLFSEGKLFGTTHGYIGEEIIAAALLSKVDIKKDSVTGTHRSHGHYIALFHDPKSLICELMGKADGVIEGKGGSQHLYRDNFYTNGITGGMVPVATGIAFSEKLKQSGNIVIAFFGDGAMNEGYVNESFNFSSIKELPVLYVLEDNQYAMSTPVRSASAGGFIDRIKALGIETFQCETTDYEAVDEAASNAIEFVRKRGKPAFIHCKTYRFCGHSKSDKCEYRPDEEEEYWLERDVLKKMREKIGIDRAEQIEKQVNDIIDEATIFAERSPWPEPMSIYRDGM